MGDKARQNFEKKAIWLEQGHVLILYSDGLIEALKGSAGMDAASMRKGGREPDEL